MSEFVGWRSVNGQPALVCEEGECGMQVRPPVAFFTDREWAAHVREHHPTSVHARVLSGEINGKAKASA